MAKAGEVFVYLRAIGSEVWNGNALPALPKRDTAAYGGDSAEPFVSGDRAQMPAASGSLQTSQLHKSE